MGGYDLSKSGASTANAWSAGASMTRGRISFRIGGRRVDVDGSRKEKMLGLGVKQALSTRTSLYADFTRKAFPARQCLPMASAWPTLRGRQWFVLRETTFPQMHL